MNRFMLSVTVATAALLGAHIATANAQTILYTPPGVSVEAATPLPFGAFVASRLNDADTTEFKSWLADSDVQGEIDLSKGYTAFVVKDEAFDPSNPSHPIEHYIVNNRIGLTTMHGNADTVTALNGDKIIISRTGNSYFVDGMRVNSAIRNPEGTIYVIGGLSSTFEPF